MGAYAGCPGIPAGLPKCKMEECLQGILVDLCLNYLQPCKPSTLPVSRRQAFAAWSIALHKATLRKDLATVRLLLPGSDSARILDQEGQRSSC